MVVGFGISVALSGSGVWDPYGSRLWDPKVVGFGIPVAPRGS